MWTITRHGSAAVVQMTSNKVNAQNTGFFDDLHRTFDELEAKHKDAAVVLTGQGRSFSVGLDLEEVLPLFATRDPEKLREWFDRYQKTNRRLFMYPRPMIAAVNGHAFAGGLITALCCDFRIAAAGDSRFSLNEVRIGIQMPSIYCEFIRHSLGEQAANLLCLGAQEYTVEQAKDLGVFHQVVDAAELEASAIKMAQDFDPATFGAYARTKRNLHAATLTNVAEISSALDEDLGGLCEIESLRVQAQKYQQLTGKKPAWEVP